ncbi:antibiotic biosynthesis monooxygenase [uncultured Roseobacter sp.]|uniref:antibiotic biosynthesis monooxygenase family protein n=1 Tax=uncultured Roseobacter sp. TaxID=114847 RepID=UPI0026017D16|nr:antibiotic biosynthesis monooxygenase [uncultured Roseobacter sp.]
MHALLFEMEPRSGHEAHYFRHADALRPLLAEHKGLLFIERFKSLSRPNVILSHSHWRDEASLSKWRSDPKHHSSQAAGRNKHFQDYRIRISHVLAMARPGVATETWTIEGAYADVEAIAPRYLTIIASTAEPVTEMGEAFRSVTIEESYLSVADAVSCDCGRSTLATALENPSITSAMLALVSRDYGMFERTEAPQYFPPAKADVT